MKFDRDHDLFLSASAWFGVVIFILPGIVILAVLEFAEIPARFWMPLMLIYAVGAIAHMLNYGFQAINVQMKVLSDYWENMRADR